MSSQARYSSCRSTNVATARLSLSIVTVTFPDGRQRSVRSCNKPSFFVRSRTVSPSRPGHCEGVARSRGQDWPKATAEGAREAVLTAASTAPDWAGSGGARSCGLERNERDDQRVGKDDPRRARHWRGTSRHTLVFGGFDVNPNHDAVMRISGEAPRRQAHSLRRRASHACLGSPPPRIVMGSPSSTCRRAAPNLASSSAPQRRLTPPDAAPPPPGPRRSSQAAKGRRAACALGPR